MTTNELIDMLRAMDATGNKPVVIYSGSDDFFFGITDLRTSPNGDAIHVDIGDLEDDIGGDARWR